MPSDGFELVDEIARHLPSDRWVLVGGLMVHAHARLAGVTNNRSTEDVDLVVELHPTGGYHEASRALQDLGFEPRPSIDHTAPFHRFVRGSDQVDLMAPDRTGRIGFGGRWVLPVPGASSAMRRTETFTTAAGTSVRIPTLVGALSLKGAASASSSLHPVRHAQDGVVLFACRAARNDIEMPSKSARANINRLLKAMSSEGAWTLADDRTKRLAIKAIAQLRPDWRAPAVVRSSRPDPVAGIRRGKTTPGSNSGSFREWQSGEPEQ